MVTYYFIRVYDDFRNGCREYNITTNQGPEMARLFAFLMDGGCGTEFEDPMIELAKTYTTIISQKDI